MWDTGCSTFLQIQNDVSNLMKNTDERTFQKQSDEKNDITRHFSKCPMTLSVYIELTTLGQCGQSNWDSCPKLCDIVRVLRERKFSWTDGSKLVSF